MPSIKPISALRNYTDVLKEVDAKKRVYLTRNGHGAYAIMSMAEEEADRAGWIEADDVEKEMGIYD